MSADISNLEEELKELDAKAHEAYSHGAIDDAVELYKKRIKLAADTPQELASSHKSLGLILHDKGDWGNSLGELEEALKIQKSITDHDAASFQLAIANTHLMIAEVYRAIDSPQNPMLEIALTHMEDAMKIQQVHAADSLLLAETLNSIGTVYGEVGNYKMALDYHTDCESIRIKQSPESLLASCSASNIGLILSKMGLQESALFYLTKALEIEEKLIPNTIDLADSYSNVGEVLVQMGKNEEALEKFHDALKLKQQVAPNSLYEAKTHSDLGLVMLKTNQPSEAEHHFLDAVALEERLIPDSEELSLTYNHLIQTLQLQGKPTNEYEDKMHRILALHVEKEEMLKG